MKKTLTTLIVTIGLIITGCSNEPATSGNSKNQLQSNQRLITKQMYGDKWALIVDSAIVECIDYADVDGITTDLQGYVLIVNGNKYGINGLALGRENLPPIDEWVIKDSTEMKKLIASGIDPKYTFPWPKDTRYLFDVAESICSNQ